MYVLPKTSTQNDVRVAGIHLSGANASKTALVILSCLKTNQFALKAVYEKIGSVGSVFSDERLVDILNSQGPFHAVFIDCPLTHPPCARCVRLTCPGAWKCEDVEVAYMLSIQEKNREKNLDTQHQKKKKKRKPINPQSQRLWDALQHFEHGRSTHLSYNPSMAPLVTRAMTLQRRLNSLADPISLKETAVPLALEMFCESFDLPREIALEYRKFGIGQERRDALFDAFVDSRIVHHTFSLEDALKVRGSVETFQAFIAAAMAYLYEQQKTDTPPRHFADSGGWVFTPRLESASEESLK